MLRSAGDRSRRPVAARGAGRCAGSRGKPCRRCGASRRAGTVPRTPRRAPRLAASSRGRSRARSAVAGGQRVARSRCALGVSDTLGDRAGGNQSPTSHLQGSQPAGGQLVVYGGSADSQRSRPRLPSRGDQGRRGPADRHAPRPAGRRRAPGPPPGRRPRGRSSLGGRPEEPVNVTFDRPGRREVRRLDRRYAAEAPACGTADCCGGDAALYAEMPEVEPSDGCGCCSGVHHVPHGNTRDCDGK